jgi:hypothetical protein
MKTKVVIVVFALIFGITQQSVFAQKVDIKGITSIDVNIACQLVIVQGYKPNIEILGEKEPVDNVKLTVNGSKLSLINRKDLKNLHKEDVIVKIEVEDLRQLNIGGAVDMKTVKMLHFDDFTLNISGVGNVDMDIQANRFNIINSGVANLKLNGKVKHVRINNSGVGSIGADGLVSESATVVNSGVGSVNVNATETLDASVSGIGSIKYLGKPSLNTSVSGLGRISRY